MSEEKLRALLASRACHLSRRKDQMTPEKLLEIALRAEAALTYAKSEYDPSEGAYTTATSNDTTEDLTCPLCNGEGYTEGQRYDSKETLAATVVAYGIGKGLALAEEWVENGPSDILALIAEVRQLQEAISILCEREPSKREGDALERKGEDVGDIEWEFFENIAEGNTLHAPFNSVEVQKHKDAK